MLPIFKLHMNGIIQYTACTCVCLFILFNIMFVRSMKLVLVAVIHFYCTMYCYMFTPQFLLFILLSIDRLFLILNIMNNAFCTCLLVHAHMHFLQFLLVEWLGHRVCRWSTAVNITKHIFEVNVHSQKLYMRILVITHPWEFVVLSLFMLFLTFAFLMNVQ